MKGARQTMTMIMTIRKSHKTHYSVGLAITAQVGNKHPVLFVSIPLQHLHVGAKKKKRKEKERKEIV
jgi:hypothetical protein